MDFICVLGTDKEDKSRLGVVSRPEYSRSERSVATNGMR